MKKIKIFIFGLLVSLFTVSCVEENVKVDIEGMQGRGLLLAHFSLSDFAAMDSLDNYRTIDIQINGNYLRGYVEDSYLVLPLKPGKHMIGNLLVYSGSLRISLPIFKEVTIKKGEVTNMGEGFFLFDEENKERFKLVFIEYGDENKTYLKNKYADVYKNLFSRHFNLASFVLTDKLTLSVIRKKAVVQNPALRNEKYVFGALGSIGVLKSKYNKNKFLNNKQTVRWIETNTVQNLNNCGVSKASLICLIKHQDRKDQIIYLENDTVVYRDKPGSFKVGRFVNLDNGMIYWLNSDLSILLSLDKGVTWKEIEKSKDELVSDEWGTKHRYAQRIPDITPGEKGIYIYYQYEYEPIRYFGYNSERIEKIEVSFQSKEKLYVVETIKGIYFGPNRSDFINGMIYFKAHASDKPKEIEVPNLGCYELRLLSYRNDEITVDCYKTRFTLKNEGRDIDEEALNY